MGNNHSHLKKHSAIKKIPKYDSKNLEQEKELAHFLLNNIDAIDRSHINHFMKRALFQNNFSSPIEDKLIKGECKVLDVGCGAGTWLLDLSNNYENSYFFGIDIKPIYPHEIKPKNVEFIKADIFDGLSFSDNEFDFTHIDTMSLVIEKEKWDFVLSELIRVTKPGGYIEITDRSYDFVGEGPILRKLMTGVLKTYSKRNVDPEIISHFDSKLKLQPNISNVYRDEKIIIMGPNGDKLGLVLQDIAVSFYTSEMAIETLSNEFGISKEEYKNIVKIDLIEELKQTNYENHFLRYWTQKCI
ncbi:S-adenosyl-L-methionine-dependent methyltransferase [Glomus cerebriforme]|uniref:S-adenosyl-L-methionine-dependent methyltransferase n=1 Tax=Glomus cerebriforme TaxID=658196 RepID=A0A397ST16_9GLOM|nr:S-adenosyl-L-methionine-dependent methyltransferase [Glomus cerebriforme]